jgi:hypothetical protein
MQLNRISAPVRMVEKSVFGFQEQADLIDRNLACALEKFRFAMDVAAVPVLLEDQGWWSSRKSKIVAARIAVYDSSNVRGAGSRRGAKEAATNQAEARLELPKMAVAEWSPRRFRQKRSGIMPKASCQSPTTNELLT